MSKKEKNFKAIMRIDGIIYDIETIRMYRAKDDPYLEGRLNDLQNQLNSLKEEI